MHRLCKLYMYRVAVGLSLRAMPAVAVKGQGGLCIIVKGQGGLCRARKGQGESLEAPLGRTTTGARGSALRTGSVLT